MATSTSRPIPAELLQPGPMVTDHALEAECLLRAFITHIEDLPPADQIAYAQVHADLARARATEANTEAVEALTQVAQDILGELSDAATAAAPRPARGASARAEHRGFTVAATRVLPFLWAVDIYMTADPEHGEGPSSLLSCGAPARAMRRGLEWADQLADRADFDHEQQVAADTYYDGGS